MDEVKKCEVCQKPLTKENTADSVNGFEIREPIKEAGGLLTTAKEACKSCYTDFRKAKDGK